MVIQVSPNGWTDREIGLEWLKHFDLHTREHIVSHWRLLVLDGHCSHTSQEFIRYCEDHKIIPLCLPPHSTHILQPLDLCIFSALAKAYKTIVRNESLFGATTITNEQFLDIFQRARSSISKNIPAAWRAAGLMPFNPAHVLERYKPKTPPTATFTNEDGISVNVVATGPALAKRINDIVEQLRGICVTPLRNDVAFVQQTCLEAIADRVNLKLVNDALVNKQRQRRLEKTRKHYGEARVLTVQAMLDKQAERDEAEALKTTEQLRKRALKGKVGFAKLVWKELRMGTDVFT